MGHGMTNKLSLSREAAALRISELDRPFTQLFTKHSVLFFEVVGLQRAVLVEKTTLRGLPGKVQTEGY